MARLRLWGFSAQHCTPRSRLQPQVSRRAPRPQSCSLQRRDLIIKRPLGRKFTLSLLTPGVTRPLVSGREPDGAASGTVQGSSTYLLTVALLAATRHSWMYMSVYSE